MILLINNLKSIFLLEWTNNIVETPSDTANGSTGTQQKSSEQRSTSDAGISKGTILSHAVPATRAA